MLGMIIDNLRIAANTNKGVFSVDIPFKNGLNLIRAENSSGKSTCINAIAYGLGLEAILGPKSKRPFPKSLYEVIYKSKDDEVGATVQSSYISIMATNSKGESVKINRDVLGDEDKVTIVHNNISKDYFLGSSGNVGSAKSERGFHRWLANFLGWDLPSVVTYEGKESKLYIECIFPLFFIEQKRGWSEIQANIPTSYGIKNVKKSAIEFCLGIDSFDYEKKVTVLRNRVDSSEREWQQLISSAEGIADFNSIILNRIPDLKNFKGTYHIQFLYQVGSATLSVSEKKSALISLNESLSKQIDAARPDSEELNGQRAVVRQLRRESDDVIAKIEAVMLSIADVDGKTASLSIELDKYHQLRRLKSVGSLIDSELETETCPICESELYDTLGGRNVKAEPMTLEENIDFLKSQLDFYVSIKIRNIETLENLQSQKKLISVRLKEGENTLNNLRKDLDDIDGDTKHLLREKIETDIALREVQKIERSLHDLKEQASRIHSDWATANASLKKLRENSRNANGAKVVSSLSSLVKDNLIAFNFSGPSINQINISKQTLRPEQEGYNIVAETSASDYIRIIWAYTLSLLQLAGQSDDVLHGGFVVFDEPRQHEASSLSFSNLIQKAAEAREYKGQVIFATSINKSELEKACKNQAVNLLCFDDYILVPEDDS